METLNVRLLVLVLAGAALLAGCGGSADDKRPQAEGVGAESRAKTALAVTASPATVVALTKVSEKRIGRTLFEYAFKVSVRNDAVARVGVIARLQGAGPGTAIVRNEVAIGDIGPGGTATSEETVVVRHDRTTPFDQSALQWLIASKGDLADAQIDGVTIANENPDRLYKIAGIDFSAIVRLLVQQGQSAGDVELTLTKGSESATVGRNAGDWMFAIGGANLVGGQELKLELRVLNPSVGRYALVPINIAALAATHSSQGTIDPVVGGSVATSSGQVIKFSGGRFDTPIAAFLSESLTPDGTRLFIIRYSANILAAGVTVQLPNWSGALPGSPLAGPALQRAKTMAQMQASAVGACRTDLPDPYSAGDMALGASNEPWAAVLSNVTVPNKLRLREDKLQAVEIITPPALVNAGSTPPLPRSEINVLNRFELHSVLPRQSCDLGEGEVVLFVHGYQPDPTVKLLDWFGLGGGRGTWEEFPRLVMDAGRFGQRRLVPFEFRWLTNASFSDVATDLATAINLIQATVKPKKIHIVAHSFGGVLARTLLQGHATVSTSVGRTEADIKLAIDAVSSLVTLGAPHSGIQKFSTARLPGGQDSGIFGHCKQASCYEAGIPTALTEPELYALYGDSSKEAGFLPVDLASTAFLKSGAKLKLYIGIGLRKTPLDEAVGDQGDHLISYEGQRFLPEFRRSAPLLNGSVNLLGADVTETILGFRNFVGPGLPPFAELSGDRTRGFAHNGRVVKFLIPPKDGRPYGGLLHEVAPPGWGLEAAIHGGCTPGNDINCDHASLALLREVITGERPPQLALEDQFNGPTLESSKWNISPGSSGVYSLTNGFLNAGGRSSFDTKGKVSFSGSKIVVEYRGGGTEANVLLIDADAPTPSNAVMASNTQYRGWGLDIQSGGSFSLTGIVSGGSLIRAETSFVAANGVIDPSIKYYRLTIEGTRVTIERGIDANSIAEKIVATMASSMVGRRFYLLIGTGSPPYAPGAFDWVKVNVTP